MNQKVMLQLGAELLHEFRHGNGSADKVLAGYLAKRKFLGPKDRYFISELYFHVLRHLRRLDESILSAYAGFPIVEANFGAGFPVTESQGARAWQRLSADERQRPPKQRPADRVIDTLRLGLSGLERELVPITEVAEELVKAWPPVEAPRNPLLPATHEKLLNHALQVMSVYSNPPKAIHYDRAYSFPTWLWGMMGLGRYDDDLKALGARLLNPAQVGIRVNTLKATREQVMEVLKKGDATGHPSPLIAEGITLEKRLRNKAVPEFENGWFEFQDVGSQLVSLYAGPKLGMSVADTCAGAGGKTLHMAALMANEGRIHAFDIEAYRLRSLERRAHRAGVKNLDLSFSLGRNGEPPAELAPMDMVVIDAPCSGTGTLQRNPEARWRLSPAYIDNLCNTQQALLQQWAERVKPGGLLIYATCSLLQQENEMQIDRFLAAHPNFKPEPPTQFPVALGRHGELRLEPHRHDCDGFYAMRMRRDA